MEYNYYGYSGYTPPEKPKKEKKPLGAGAVIAISVIVSLVVGIFGGYIGMSFYSSHNPTADGTSGAVIYKSVTLKDQNGDKVKNQMSVGEVAELTKSSVVEITTEAVATGSFMMQYVTEGAGSGVIITENGYIVTNHHVIENATSISVRLSNGNSYKATLVGSDQKTDLAVIKIDAKELNAAVVGEYKDCKVGDTVIAIGNPLGELGGTVTDGIISALDRDVTIDGNIMTLMQTNTAINPGNSGGGLFNTSGQLIGVVNAKSSGEGIEGLGFAIPINLAETVIEDIIEYGYVTGRVEYGFEVLEISDYQSAMYYRVNALGVYVYSVTQNSNAWNAGLRSGDLISKVGEKEIKTEKDFNNATEKLGVGDTISVTVQRQGRSQTYEIVLEEYKPTSENALAF